MMCAGKTSWTASNKDSEIPAKTVDKPGEESSLKQSLSNLGAESNVHGISRIISDRPPFLRFLWLIAFLCAASFGIFQVSTIIKLFLAYPIKTTVQIGFEPLEFPAITICNMNIIKKSQSGNLQSQNLKDILSGTYQAQTTHSSTYSSTPAPTTQPVATAASTTASGSQPPGSSTSQPPSSTQSATQGSTGLYGSTGGAYDQWTAWYNNVGSQSNQYYGTQNSGQQQHTTIDESYILYETFVDEYQQLNRNEKTDIGHNINNMLLECQFGGTVCDKPSKKIVTFDYGNCYTFQSQRYISGSSGPIGGMSMTFNLENHESFQEMTEGYGLRLVLHEIGSFPLPSEEGMTISGGYETSLGIKLTKIRRQGHPYGSCQDPLEYFKQHFVRYSIQGCIQTCWETIAFAVCNCVVGYMQSEIDYFQKESNIEDTDPDNSTSDNSTRVQTCFTKESKSCYNSLRREFLTDVSYYCTCPPACYQNVYTTTFSGRLWPHETKMKQLQNQSCATYNTTACGIDSLSGAALSSNFLKIHIYFEDLNYELITEQPLYDITQVIADIGGSLGLCIGASLLCVCEAVEALIGVLLVVKRKLLRRHTRVMSQKQSNIQ